MGSRSEVVAVQKAVYEVAPTVEESTASLYRLRENSENGSSTSTYLPPAIVSVIVHVILSLRESVVAVVIRGLLWVLAVLVACVAWLIGHIVLSCVHCESIHSVDAANSEDRPLEVENMSEERPAELDNVEEDKSAEFESVPEEPKTRQEKEVDEDEEDNGDDGRKLMEQSREFTHPGRQHCRRRRETNDSDSSTSESSSGSENSECGASSCSTLPWPGDEKFDDLLPLIDLHCLETSLEDIEGTEECTSETEEQLSPNTPNSPISLTNEVTDFCDSTLCSKNKNGQESDTSEFLDLQTAIRLQQIVDLAALRACRGLHCEAKYPSAHLTSLLGHTIDVKKPNMDLLNSIIGI